ncbi:MAG: DUF4918 family protein [Ignavibacteria bacterium]|nr:DUF4918 family protein [Ignavibacteria bacterium]
MAARFENEISNFLTTLECNVALPGGFSILNPYSNAETCRVVVEMCRKYYSKRVQRLPIWGINPGRFGAGLTGLSFTDPYALRYDLKIESSVEGRRESSAEFIYRVISEYGGAHKFYEQNYLSALSPLGFLKNNVNINFYDDVKFSQRMIPFILECMKAQHRFELRSDKCVVLGTGKLKSYFEKYIQPEMQYQHVVFLEHPRYIMQYKRSVVGTYVDKYVKALSNE